MSTQNITLVPIHALTLSTGQTYTGIFLDLSVCPPAGFLAFYIESEGESKVHYIKASHIVEFVAEESSEGVICQCFEPMYSESIHVKGV